MPWIKASSPAWLVPMYTRRARRASEAQDTGRLSRLTPRAVAAASRQLGFCPPTQSGWMRTRTSASGFSARAASSMRT
ncbi:hypothetical protein D3C80_1784730 [compost metagenome]